ncbi:DUF2550 domain-containing protein [Kineococcus indalonis]|uniref:DUF2550 domain-containing protein n=1 Tax=Kineococcus indalonis TaxID=2696566 RepID=UPI002B1BD962|nr:DUF2550 domain-containing protein [Kineococcus indalonis]
MRELLLSLEVAGACALLVLVCLVLVVVRRRRLTGRLGTFDCSVRQPGTRRWSLGVARYETDRLDWYRTFSLSPRPSRSFARGALDVTRRRDAEGHERLAVQPDALVVECRHSGEQLELAMSTDAYTGFASWLESAPPGQNVNVA